MATENIRQAMLKQMGIVPWFPRMPLPGAATSHVYDVDTEAGVGNEIEVGQPSMPTDFRKADSLPAQSVSAKHQGESEVLPRSATTPSIGILPEVGLVSEIKRPLQPVANLQTISGADDEPVSAFAFSWFSMDKRLAVLAMLPAGSATVSRPCRQMLERILTALHNDYREMKLDEHSFHWPFPDDLGLPSGRAAARQAVDGFVARRLREQPTAMLLVLADETPPFLFPVGATGEESGALSVHRQFGFVMLRTHSLHGMEKNPELKRSAWQAMKVLLDRLSRSTE